MIHNDKIFSTRHAEKEQQIEDPPAEFSLLQVELLAVPCDKEDLCADVSFIPMSPLVNNCDTFALGKYKCDDKIFLPIACAQDELKLLSSLYILGYIEFDVLCNLNCLEKKLFQNSSLPCFDRYSFYAIGKYDMHGECMVHWIYICSDLCNSVVVHEHILVENCANTKHVLSSSPSFVYLTQDLSQEREPYQQQPSRTIFTLHRVPMMQTSSTHLSKPRKVCRFAARKGE
jgi:hypothetical protein